jgi:hypothetical protein
MLRGRYAVNLSQSGVIGGGGEFVRINEAKDSPKTKKKLEKYMKILII